MTVDAAHTVAIVDASIARTGAFVGARNIAQALEGVARVVLVVPTEARLDDRDLAAFAAVHRLPIANLRRSVSGLALYLPKLLVSSWRLRQLLRHHNCTRLVLNDFYLMHGAACRVMGYRGRIVSWVRMDPFLFSRPLARIWLLLMRTAADEVVVVSRYIKKKVPSSKPSRIIYDPFAPPEGALPVENPNLQRRIVFVGNYINGKGQDDALEAFAPLARDYPDARLEFYGGDMGLEKNRKFLAALKDRAQQLGLKNQISFNGFVDDPARVLAGAYMALNFSGNESFSMTVLEASGAGLPVIATRCGGPEEIIEDGVTGILVPVGDRPLMTAAVRRLLANPLPAAEMGAMGQRRVQAVFSSTSFRDNVRDVLES